MPYSRLLLKQTLTQAGCDVVTANTADDALRMVRQASYGLVVVDLVSTPGASDQLVLEIRVLGSTVPLLLMLQAADRDLLRRLSNLKPIGFLTKPLVVDSLTSLLPKALAGDKELLSRSAEMARMGRAAARDAEAFVVGQSAGSVDEQRLQRMFGDLPMLPSVLSRLLELSNRDDATAQEMAEVISSDPRLSSQLLRVVNSAFFGFSRRIATIPEATVILGTQALRQLASGAAVSQFFGGSSTVLDRTQLWRHSLGVGVASRLLAQQVAPARAEEAFTAGLLHDFGRVCLDRYMCQEYGQAVHLAREQQVPLLETETATLGLTHAWVSGWLALNWNLPAVLAESMLHHHQPESAAESSRQVASVVNVANVVCHEVGLSGVEGVLPTGAASAYGLGILGLDAGEVASIGPQVLAETAALEKQLGELGRS